MIEIDHIRAAGAEMFVLVSVGSHENLAVKFQNCGSGDSVNCLQERMRPRDGVTARRGRVFCADGDSPRRNTAVQRGHPIFGFFLCEMMRASCDVSIFRSCEKEWRAEVRC